MQNRFGLTNDQFSLIPAQLAPSEGLCWAGSEPRLRYWRGRGLRISLFALWTILTSAWAALMILMNPSFLRNTFLNMLPVLLPFGLAALGLYLLGRAIFRPLKTGPEVYAITTRRALIIAPGKVDVVWSYGPREIQAAQIRRRKSGSGDILFERVARWGQDAEGRSTCRVEKVGFYGLACVDEVSRLLQQIGQPERWVSIPPSKSGQR